MLHRVINWYQYVCVDRRVTTFCVSVINTYNLSLPIENDANFEEQGSMSHGFCD